LPLLGIHTTGSPSPCVHCALSRSKKANIPKITLTYATAKGERIALDISYPSCSSFGGSKYWLLTQDEFIGCFWSIFLKARSVFPDLTLSWLHNFQKDNSLTVKFIRCDNSGENIQLQSLVHEDKTLAVRFELAAPYTPEKNGMVERKYATLYGKVKAIFNWAKFPIYLRQLLWAECANHATDL
jgi:hypothetical protein